MSDRIDELFDGGIGKPTVRRTLIYRILAIGLLLATVGMLCTAVPGGLLVLWAWSMLETEQGRLESGYLPPDAAAELRGMRRTIYASVGVILVLFIAQALLLMDGWYEVFWENSLRIVLSVFGA